MTPQHIFRLGFWSTQGHAININLPLADLTATEQTVRTAMDNIINSGVVYIRDQRPVSRKSARITTHTVTDFDIVPTQP